MKNMESNVGSFAIAKLQAKMLRILAIIALVAVIGFSFAACGGGGGGDGDGDGGGSGGTFTLTDIPSEYEGWYAEINQFYNGLKYLDGADDVLLNKYPRISGGRVSIPLWSSSESEPKPKRYTGNDMIDINVYFSPKDGDEFRLQYVNFGLVEFSNGSAARSWKDVVRNNM